MPSAIFLGVKGNVIALDRATGKEEWRTRLKGPDFVNVVLDKDVILATTKGPAFCLDARSGRLLWDNPLPGLGLGLITIATASGSSTIGPLREKREQAHRQQGGAT